MKRHLLALVALTALGLALVAAPASASTPVPVPDPVIKVGAEIVVAVPPAPSATKIDVAKSCGRVTLTFTGPDDNVSGTHGFRWNAVNGSVATEVGARTGTVTVADDDVKKLNIDFAEDEFGGVAAVTVAAYFGPNSHLQIPLDIYPVDTDCRVPDVTTTPPTAAPPTSSTAPAPAPLPVVVPPNASPTVPAAVIVTRTPVGAADTGGGPAE